MLVADNSIFRDNNPGLEENFRRSFMESQSEVDFDVSELSVPESEQNPPSGVDQIYDTHFIALKPVPVQKAHSQSFEHQTELSGYPYNQKETQHSNKKTSPDPIHNSWNEKTAPKMRNKVRVNGMFSSLLEFFPKALGKTGLTSFRGINIGKNQDHDRSGETTDSDNDREEMKSETRSLDDEESMSEGPRKYFRGPKHKDRAKNEEKYDEAGAVPYLPIRVLEKHPEYNMSLPDRFKNMYDTDDGKVKEASTDDKYPIVNESSKTDMSDDIDELVKNSSFGAFDELMEQLGNDPFWHHNLSEDENVGEESWNWQADYSVENEDDQKSTTMSSLEEFLQAMKELREKNKEIEDHLDKNSEANSIETSDQFYDNSSKFEGRNNVHESSPVSDEIKNNPINSLSNFQNESALHSNRNVELAKTLGLKSENSIDNSFTEVKEVQSEVFNQSKSPSRDFSQKPKWKKIETSDDIKWNRSNFSSNNFSLSKDRLLNRSNLNGLGEDGDSKTVDGDFETQYLKGVWNKWKKKPNRMSNESEFQNIISPTQAKTPSNNTLQSWKLKTEGSQSKNDFRKYSLPEEWQKLKNTSEFFSNKTKLLDINSSETKTPSSNSSEDWNFKTEGNWVSEKLENHILPEVWRKLKNKTKLLSNDSSNKPKLPSNNSSNDMEMKTEEKWGANEIGRLLLPGYESKLLDSGSSSSLRKLVINDSLKKEKLSKNYGKFRNGSKFSTTDFRNESNKIKSKPMNESKAKASIFSNGASFVKKLAEVLANEEVRKHLNASDGGAENELDSVENENTNNLTHQTNPHGLNDEINFKTGQIASSIGQKIKKQTQNSVTPPNEGFWSISQSDLRTKGGVNESEDSSVTTDKSSNEYDKHENWNKQSGLEIAQSKIENSDDDSGLKAEQNILELFNTNEKFTPDFHPDPKKVSTIENSTTEEEDKQFSPKSENQETKKLPKKPVYGHRTNGGFLSGAFGPIRQLRKQLKTGVGMFPNQVKQHFHSSKESRKTDGRTRN